MIKGYQAQVLEIYEKIRSANKSEQKKRKEEIQKLIPIIPTIQRQIGKLCVKLTLNTINNIENREDSLNTIKNEITNLKIKKSELLVENGYPIDYLDEIYSCNKCKDTGFIGTRKCICFNKKLVKLYYKDSELSSVLKRENFNTFTYDYFSNRRVENKPKTPRKNMEEIFPRALNYAESFNEKSENLLFYGEPGTGKTFLTHCIAKELLDRGFFVLYRTAENLFRDLRDIRLNNNSNLENLLLNCDLLIIDDLGTEQISRFTKTELFNLLNTKLLSNKKMLVSTNYSLDELMSTYTDRITSRLLGNFHIFNFYNDDDIRVKLNLNKIKNQ
ncbi:ATP-binding protein [Clostridium sediminicola]|uniref:ATP-binding protein n=1 Tax=Clostridium sediminicola TaxID=3114879 RepID=UPI0031F1DDDC